jgi:hypothetical protein
MHTLMYSLENCMEYQSVKIEIKYKVIKLFIFFSDASSIHKATVGMNDTMRYGFIFLETFNIIHVYSIKF